MTLLESWSQQMSLMVTNFSGARIHSKSSAMHTIRNSFSRLDLDWGYRGKRDICLDLIGLEYQQEEIEEKLSQEWSLIAYGVRKTLETRELVVEKSFGVVSMAHGQ